VRTSIGAIALVLAALVTPSTASGAPPDAWDAARRPDAAAQAQVVDAAETLLDQADVTRHDRVRHDLAAAARSMLDQIHAAEGNDPRAVFLLGHALHLLSDDTRAIQVLAPAVERWPEHPGNAQALFPDLAVAYARASMPKEEIHTYDMYLERQPAPHGRQIALSNRAESKLKLGDLEGAIRDYRASLEIDGSEPLARYGLAVTLDRSGDLGHALEEAALADQNDRRFHISRLEDGGVFFVPEYDRYWYYALREMARAYKSPRAVDRRDHYSNAVAWWQLFVSRALGDDRWLPLAQARLKHCETRVATAAAEVKREPRKPRLRGARERSRRAEDALGDVRVHHVTQHRRQLGRGRAVERAAHGHRSRSRSVEDEEQIVRSRRRRRVDHVHDARAIQVQLVRALRDHDPAIGDQVSSPPGRAPGLDHRRPEQARAQTEQQDEREPEGTHQRDETERRRRDARVEDVVCRADRSIRAARDEDGGEQAQHGPADVPRSLRQEPAPGEQGFSAPHHAFSFDETLSYRSGGRARHRDEPVAADDVPQPVRTGHAAEEKRQPAVERSRRNVTNELEIAHAIHARVPVDAGVRDAGPLDRASVATTFPYNIPIGDEVLRPAVPHLGEEPEGHGKRGAPPGKKEHPAHRHVEGRCHRHRHRRGDGRQQNQRPERDPMGSREAHVAGVTSPDHLLAEHRVTVHGATSFTNDARPRRDLRAPGRGARGERASSLRLRS
jgi:tetratricopeptide (TPR) repeat protein